MTEYRGIDNDPCSNINFLQNHLRHLYPNGFPILKELVQNADDAQARTIALGWSRGISAARHCLLRGPAVILVNDGQFRPGDEESIFRLNMNSKAGERGAIGKFGLGLKSVFHLCEAFFYLASPISPGQEIRRCICNPWASRYDDVTSFHGGWNQFCPEDAQAVACHLGPLLTTPSWFCLWIPLRRRVHLEGGHPIIEEYPGDRDSAPVELFAEDVGIELACLFPMLAHVTKVKCWHTWDGPAAQRPSFEVRLAPAAGRRLFPARDQLDQEERLKQEPQVYSGHIDVLQRTGENFTVRYAGVESWLERLEGFKREQAWPKSMRTNSATGRPEQREEKAEPHCAACFIAVPGSESSLRVTRAVFLPLTRSTEWFHLDGGQRLRLLLHGYFFIDAGRGDLELGSANGDGSGESALRKRWNEELLHAGTLPLVLRAVSEFVREAGLSVEDTKSLTQALADPDQRAGKESKFEPLGQRYRKQICGQAHWFYRLGPEQADWSLTSGDLPIHELPDPGDAGGQLCHDTFPRLGNYVAERGLTFAGWPRLHSDAAVQPWPAVIVQELLELDVAALFAEAAERFQYFVRFVDSCFPAEPAPEILDALHRRLRDVFARVGRGRLREQLPAVQRLLKRFPTAHRLAVTIPTNIADKDRQPLLAHPLGILLVPREFEPNDRPGTGRLSVADAATFLALLPPFGAPIANLAQEILLATEGDREALLQQCADLAIWSAKLGDAGKVESQIMSLNRLRERLGHALLFHSASPAQAQEFQQALAVEQAAFIADDLAETLFGKNQVPAYTAGAVAAALTRGPALAPGPARAPLLSWLLRQGPAPEDRAAWKHACRYLLHGDPAHMKDEAPLLLGEARSAGVWARVVRRLLELQQGAWCVLDTGPLVAPLTDEVKETLHIQPVGAVAGAQLLAAVGPERLDLDFSADERARLLEDLRRYPDLLKRLPLHEGQDGKLHRIGPDTYWQGGYEPDEATRRRVRLLRLHADPFLAGLQKPLAPVLDAVAAVRLLLDGRQPPPWRELLRALSHIEQLPQDQLRDKLTRTPWLPLRAGGTVAPERVLVLGKLNDEVARFLADGPGDAGAAGNGRPVGQLMLHAELLEDELFDEAQRHKLFPARDVALGRLGEVLGNDEKYRVGKMPAFEEDDLERLLTAFERAPERILPVRDLIDQVHRTDPKACRNSFFPKLCRPVVPKRLENILTHLVGRHESASLDLKRDILKVHGWYLTMFVDEPEYRALQKELLPRLRLLSQRGNWKQPDQLCFEATGIDYDDVLDAGQAKILESIVVAKPQPVAIPQVHGAAGPPSIHYFRAQVELGRQALKSYFEPWTKVADAEVVTPWVGAFLCLLGDQLDKLSRQYLPANRTVQQTRANAGLAPRPRPGRSGGGQDESVDDMMRCQHFCVEVAALKGMARLVHLLGGPFDAKVLARPDDLFLGYGIHHVDVSLQDGWRVHWLSLRALDPDPFDKKALGDLLIATARRLMGDVYGQRNTTFEQVLKNLDEGEQFDLMTAQLALLNGAGQYLGQLGVDPRGPLREFLRLCEEAQDRHAEELEAERQGRKMAGESTNEKLLKARKHLNDKLLETDGAAAGSILQAMRRKINEFQYHPESVLFELFQNADDAYVELDQVDMPRPGAECRFVVEDQGDRLLVLHAGRRLNYPPRSAEQQSGHHRDLRKMLTLAHSEKRPESGGVTGRFGLGFKSVFLLCDRPCVVSGRLGFEVLGTMFPRPLPKDQAERLRQSLAEHGLAPQSGTAFALPLASDRNSCDRALKAFQKLAHYLVVFAHRIRRCDLQLPGRRTGHVGWNETTVIGAAGSVEVVTGTLQPLPDVEDEAVRALLLRTEVGQLLFRIESHGFGKLPPHVPTIWVTAPTREYAGLGFALNATFALDLGRAQLANSREANQAEAQTLGHQFGEALLALASAAADDAWSALAKSIGLLPTVMPYEFWWSLWKLLSGGTGRGESASNCVQLVRRILWDADSGAALRLFSERAVLPTGMDAAGLSRLLRIADVCWTLRGHLDAHPADIAALVDWPGVRNVLSAGIISASRVEKVLDELAPGRLPATREALDLARILQRELNDERRVDEPTATRLGTFFTRDRLAMLTGPVCSEDERRLPQYLEQLLFKSQAGTYERAADLLIGVERGTEYRDEVRRAAFAPALRVLAKVYGPPGTDFFLACREQKNADTKEMAQWAIQATNSEQQKAVLAYLKQGDLAAQVMAALRSMGIAGTWLGQLSKDALKNAGLDDVTQHIVLAGLGRLELFPEPPPEPPPPPPGHARKILQRLRSWWDRNREQEVRKFENAIYPDGRVPRLHREPPGHDPDQRQEWLRLFIVAMMHTLGRTQAEQHQAFLGLCEERDWLELLAQPGFDPGPWANAVQGYIDEQVDNIRFYFWLRQFPGIATVAKYIDQYAAALLDMNRLDRPFALGAVLMPRTNPRFQGTEIDAPPLTPILGIGSCFVVRELLRLGVVRNPFAHRFCYVPEERVRKLIQKELGGPDVAADDAQRWEQSGAICDFLKANCDDPTFGGAFDLPLLAAAENPGLRDELFRE